MPIATKPPPDERRRVRRLLLLASVLAFGSIASATSAQETKIITAEGQPAVSTPDATPGARPSPSARPMPGSAPTAIPGATPGATPGTGQPAAGTPAANATPGEGPKPITRPDKPSLPPDPRELKVTANPDGKIKFNFHGQPWGHVLEWLAAISAMSLDWQELPGDYLNLVTTREYTVPEARDLINRHLLARGYTILQQGEILSVVKIEKVNPGMVRRVEPEELADCLPHEFVKVSFPLDWLISEKAVEELKPMLSPNAKLTALKNTNRLEALDSAQNLQQIYQLIKREQSTDSEQRLVKDFALEHTRAADVVEQLKVLLGMQAKSAAPTNMSPQQMEMMQQQQQMMMQQQQQRQGNQPMPTPQKEAEVRLVANSRNNSILAHAPPDKMEVITQAIAAIDVPADHAHSLLTNINRMQVYRLHAVSPETLVKTLMEIGQLDPTTHLEVDTKSKAIIAYASLADHLTIRQVVDRLDGSGRKFEVVSLRRLEADYVAGTIEFMMLGPPPPKQQQSRYYDFYSPFSRSQSETKETDSFRVDADTENNRLLLWTNEIELEEVMNLLAKLGEIPARGGNPERLRVLDEVSPDDLRALIDRVKETWPSIAPNELTLPPVPPAKAEEAAPMFDHFDTTPANPASDKSADQRESHRPRFLLAAAPEGTNPAPPATETEPSPPAVVPPQVDQGADRPAASAPRVAPPNPADRNANAAPGSLPPVRISLSPDGRIVLYSEDTGALDMLEELIQEISPPRRDYRIYRLRHADSFWVRKNLEDFFTEEDDKSNNSRHVYYYDNYSANSNKDEPRQRLSRKRKLKLIDDLDTNSILVQGADAAQLRTIEDLIRIYDQPQQADASSARVSSVIQIQYSKAQTIANAVKDVYRDLLSSNDKALASNNPEQRNRVPTGANTYIFNEEGAGGGEKERTRVTFKGKVSIGVDEVTNTLLVSTEGENLMRNISDMVKSLDDAAKPLSTVSIVPIGGHSNADHVREVLARILSEGKAAAPPANGQPQRPQPQTPQGNEGNVQTPTGEAGPQSGN